MHDVWAVDAEIQTALTEKEAEEAAEETSQHLEQDVSNAEGSRELACVAAEHESNGHSWVVVRAGDLGPENYQDEYAEQEATQILSLKCLIKSYLGGEIAGEWSGWESEWGTYSWIAGE